MTKARDLANASTALSAVSATELGYVDGVTSAIQTQLDAKLATATAATTYVPNSLADAKGDLLTATADNTPARLAVGSNGETIVADSAATTGLGWAGNYAAGKNKIINGAFNVNQRAFTSNTATGTYNFDRWVQINGGTSGTLTITPQVFTPGTAPVAGYEGTNYVQCVTAAGASVGTYAVLDQRIESVRTFAGQTMTLSFWAKAASGTPKIALELEQDFGTGGSPSSTVLTPVSTVTISTSWARYSITTTVPSISGKTLGTTANTGYLGINLWLSAGSDFATRGSSIGLQNNTFQIWGVQAEAGSVATAFQTATGTIQGELAACQRYYFRMDGAGAADSPKTVAGFSVATGTSRIVIPLPVTLRVKPSSLDYNNMRLDTGATTYTITSMGYNDISPTSVEVSATVTSGPAAGTAVRFIPTSGSTTSYLGFNAELQEIKMDNVTFLEIDGKEHALIANADGSFTSMLKSTYDAQVEHLTEIPPQAALSTPSV